MIHNHVELTGESRQVRRRKQRESNKSMDKFMKMSDIKEIDTFDDKLTDSWLLDFDNWYMSKTLLERGYFCAGTGTGKTHFMHLKLMPHLIENYNGKVFIQIAPETMLVSKSSKRKFMKKLKKMNIVPEQFFNETISDTFETLEDIANGEEDYVYITLTDSKFREQMKYLLPKLEKLGLLEDTYIFVDEGAVGSVSSAEWYRHVYGVDNPQYKGSKYKVIGSCLKKVGGLILFLPNPTNEMVNIGVGTEDYVSINKFPTKDEMLYRTACWNPTQWFDKNTKALDTLSDFFGKVMSDQLEQDAMYHELINKGIVLNTSKTNLNPKRAGIVKMETKYKLVLKDERDYIKKVLLEANFPRHWDFKICFLGGGTLDMFQANNGKIELVETPYGYDEDDVIRDLADNENKLRFLFVTNKAGMGVDVPNLYDVLALRIPVGRTKENEPTVLLGLNFLGRAMRQVVTHEELSLFFQNNQEDLYRRYYVMVNGFTPWLPRKRDNEEKGYWEETEKVIHNIFNSTLEVLKSLTFLK